MQPILIYAKWTHRQNTTGKDGTSVTVYYYEVPIPPSEPIKIGKHAKVILLASAKHHSLARTMGPSPPLYDTYDQQIEGPIASATPLSSGAIAFVLENWCIESPVRYAHIAAPYAPGRITNISPYQYSMTTELRIPQPFTRYIRTLAIEDDAIVDREAWIRMLPPVSQQNRRAPSHPLPPNPEPSSALPPSTPHVEGHSRGSRNGG